MIKPDRPATKGAPDRVVVRGEAGRASRTAEILFSSPVMRQLRQEVKQNSPVYLHQRVYEGLRTFLLEADLQPGDKLPTHVQVAAFLHMGPESVRKAMRRLAKEGVVANVSGRGTFIL